MLSFHRVVRGLRSLRSFSTVLPRRAQEVKAWVDAVVLHHNFCFKAARFTCQKNMGVKFFYKFFIKQKTGFENGVFKRGLFFFKSCWLETGGLEFSQKWVHFFLLGAWGSVS